jgi:hypothetical protein
MGRRLALSAGLLLALAPRADAATYDPQIAYSVAGGRNMTLYLANADGSRAVAVLTARLISDIDLSPAGNQVAFADTQGVKVVNFTATNSGITASAPVLLRAGGVSPDFSADGTRILFRDVPTQSVAIVPSGGGASVPLYPSDCGQPRWVREASLGKGFVCKANNYHDGTMDMEMWLVLLDANDGIASADMVFTTATQAFKGIEDFDVARTRDALVMSVNYLAPTPPGAIEYDLATGTITPRGAARRVHYSAGDARMLYITPHQASGDYVRSVNLATGAVITHTKKGDYNSLDARP